MSPQAKWIAAVLLLASLALGVAAWFVLDRPDGTRPTRSLTDRPLPSASASRSAPLEPKPRLEVPKTADELEAEQRAAQAPPPSEEAPPLEPKRPARASRPQAPAEALEPPPPVPPRPAEPGRIAGLVLDETGHPVQARIMLVGAEGGSVGGGNTAADGTFDIERRGHESFQLKAWTTDGRVGVLDHGDGDGSLGVPDAIVRLEKGARVKLVLEGELESCRVALFTGNVRHSDFTLRKDQADDEVVPAGSLYVEAYTGSGDDKVLYESRSLFLSPDQVEEVVFTLYP